MIRRFTATAEDGDLAVFQHDADIRGVSLAQVIREVLAQAAATRREGRPRPRVGFAPMGTGVAKLSIDDQASPWLGRLRS